MEIGSETGLLARQALRHTSARVGRGVRAVRARGPTSRVLEEGLAPGGRTYKGASMHARGERKTPGSGGREPGTKRLQPRRGAARACRRGCPSVPLACMRASMRASAHVQGRLVRETPTAEPGRVVCIHLPVCVLRPRAIDVFSTHKPERAAHSVLRYAYVSKETNHMAKEAYECGLCANVCLSDVSALQARNATSV